MVDNISGRDHYFCRPAPVQLPQTDSIIEILKTSFILYAGGFNHIFNCPHTGEGKILRHIPGASPVCRVERRFAGDNHSRVTCHIKIGILKPCQISLRNISALVNNTLNVCFQYIGFEALPVIKISGRVPIPALLTGRPFNEYFRRRIIN